MLKKSLVLLALAGLCTISNCSGSLAVINDATGTLAPGGFFYTQAEVPFDIAKKPQEDNGQGLVNVNSFRNLAGLKKGEAYVENVLGMVELGEGGIYNAARNGNIQKIYYVDVQKQRIYCWYSKITTIVYGE